MSEHIQQLKQALKRAGLEDETCPMINCYGHLTYVESEQFFKCPLCGEIFPTTKASKQWKETNKVISLLLQKWEEEARLEAELLGED